LFREAFAKKFSTTKKPTLFRMGFCIKCKISL
jgi:hypothetical protein